MDGGLIFIAATAARAGGRTLGRWFYRAAPVIADGR
jgi:hypothetical protein